MKRVVLLVLLVVFLAYMSTREHMTSGPPTLHSLQTDTRELDSRLTKLTQEFESMKQQASAGASAAATARLQLKAVQQS